MRRFAFSITILLLFILILLLNLPPKTVSSPQDLAKFQPNQRIQVSGTVIKESFSSKYKTLYLDNSLKLECDLACPKYLNKKISALVILERYDEQEYLKVLEISESPP